MFPPLPVSCADLSADVQVEVQRLEVQLSYAPGRRWSRRPLGRPDAPSLLRLAPPLVALALGGESLLLPIKHLEEQEAGLHIDSLSWGRGLMWSVAPSSGEVANCNQLTKRKQTYIKIISHFRQ